jgi:UDP-N-acetylmuramoylalanine--D-glutamate ligase
MVRSARYLLIGFGVTGRAVASWVRAHDGSAIVVEDRPTPEMAAQAAQLGVELVAGPDADTLAGLVQASEIVVPSPGVPVGHSIYGLAASAGRPLFSEIELAYRALASRPDPKPILAAITGTNGKTTVTELVASMLNATGRPAVTGGNIGIPLIEAVTSDAEVVVAEVSSFQLQFTETFRPQASCWLNLSPDHLDWHPDLDHYAAAKARIWAHQGGGDTAVFNLDDPRVAAAARRLPPAVRPVTFAASDRAAAYRVEDGHLVADGLGQLIAVADLPRALPHDLVNSLAAAALAGACGATVAGIAAALRTTTPGRHRVELIGEGSALRWYDDSKATTPASVVAAVSGFTSVVLIAGGRNKGLDLSGLAATAPPVHAVVAIGEAAAEIEAAFKAVAPVRHASSMAEAVGAAAAMARPGDAVVLSPGAASFDWYRSYAERGDDFASIVRDRLEKGNL